LPIQRKCDKCEEKEKAQDKKKEEDKNVQRKEVAAPAAVTRASTIAGAISSGSQYLPPALSYHFGSRMGHEFGDTKIHTGSAAAQSAKAIHARAYTLGNHIVFAEGQYQPDTYEGKKLLAHELVHVVQQKDGTALYRQSDETSEPPTEEGAAEETPIATSGSGEQRFENQRDFANCAGVSVKGWTDANYSHSHSFSGSARLTKGCKGCGDEECVSDSGTIVSVFDANPSVTLPDVPDGLNECEAKAVETFINGTLNAHEQQHVAAFNTYKGKVTTKFTYTGCLADEAAFVETKHNAIESARRAASNARSAKLDPFNPPIPCKCPDTETKASDE
jgi:hypothetical protein